MEVSKTEGAVPTDPSERRLEAGLSGVLGGCSGGTLASTQLSLADFSTLSRGNRSAGAAGRAAGSGCDPKPRRRSARRHPAPRAGGRSERNLRGRKRRLSCRFDQCNSETSSGIRKRDLSGRDRRRTSAWPACIQ